MNSVTVTDGSRSGYNEIKIYGYTTVFSRKGKDSLSSICIVVHAMKQASPQKSGILLLVCDSSKMQFIFGLVLVLDMI